MKLVMVSGSYPPDVCGGGHYTQRLVEALEMRGVSVEVITGTDWGVKTVPRVQRLIRTLGADLTHIQYPTVGYGRKLGPHLVGLLERAVVTLHEASQTHILRQLSLFPFLFGRHIIFTNRFEQAYVSRIAPWVSQRSSVIPIGSNVPIGRADCERKLDEIVYFGLIRPAKGLESVLDLAGILKQRVSGMTVRIIGLAQEKHMSYLNALREQSASLPVVWDLGLSNEATADRLARVAYAYAPFPDGASERRGSLLALLANGVATITMRGPQTPHTLEKTVEFAASPEDAASILEALSSDPGRRQELSRHGVQYASQFSWLAIADLHIELYQTRLKQHRGRVA
jgi:glycosyltransferase involved in cell wall biosynthesis